MSIHATTARHARTSTVEVDRRGPGRKSEGPSPLLGTLVCLAILVGGAFAGADWAAAQCAGPAAAELGAVCAAL